MYCMLWLVSEIFPTYILIFLVFAVTFIIFPSITSIRKTFDWGNQAWPEVLLLTIFNLGDTIGKTMIKYRNIFNKQSIIYLTFGRSFFIASSILILYKCPLLDNNYYPFINIFVMAITNGFCVGASFILAFEMAKNKSKTYAGMIGGFFLQFGIIIGSLLAIPINQAIPDYIDWFIKIIKLVIKIKWIIVFRLEHHWNRWSIIRGRSLTLRRLSSWGVWKNRILVT